jgi:lipoyl(octanoyl) transferase
MNLVPTPNHLNAIWLGTRPYAPLYELQCQLMDLRKADRIQDVVLLLEHEPTITSGRGAHAENFLSPPALLEANGIATIVTDRGGDVTLHAPGQLVAYPIVKLGEHQRDVRKYVNGLTRVMQGIVAPFGIAAGTADGMVGLWTDGQRPGEFVDFANAELPLKIGAIGVRISRWVTMHGFALNLTTDLALFQHIVPCGISQYGVASVASLVGQTPAVETTARAAFPLFCETLGRTSGEYYSETGPLEVARLEQMLRFG